MDYLKKKRFKDGLYCVHCKHDKVYTLKGEYKFRCGNKSCRKDFTITTKTIFHGSKIPLPTWFMAMFLLNNSSKGISSVQLAKQLGVTQKTAWFIDHRIRETYKQGKEIMQGTVKADETFVGGKEKNKHASKKKGEITKKEVIIGIRDRETKKVKAQHVENTKARTLKAYIYDNLETGSTLITDDNMAYRHTRHIYKHKVVKHGVGQYVDGDTHTNSIESFWSIVKRGYIGVYHYWSKKHLQRYIDEYTFRHNNRKSNNMSIVSTCMDNLNNRISYK